MLNYLSDYLVKFLMLITQMHESDRNVSMLIVFSPTVTSLFDQFTLDTQMCLFELESWTAGTAFITKWENANSSFVVDALCQSDDCVIIFVKSIA